MKRLLPLAAILLVPLAPLRAQDVALADMPNVTVTYYDVTGTTPAEIRASINAHRGVDPNDGKPVDALTHSQMRWRWRQDARGTCYPATAEVTWTATVRMPRLANEAAVSDDVRAGWHAYIAALELHESGHVTYVRDHVPAMQAAMRATADCAALHAAGQAGVADVVAHDRDYDRDTRHGLTQGAHYP